MLTFFLSSGLFLGWSLGANDAANVFGTAVGSRMIRFRTAACCCSIFLILGAVVSGAGTTETLGKLGAVNAIAGAFIVALAAALSVYLMTKAGYPVSTSQAIVGAILGWNLFAGATTDYHALKKIVLTWVACPALAAAFSVGLYKLTAVATKKISIHMFRLDAMTRYGLFLAGIFGSYSLGANNIANVMGVFVPVSPFKDLSFFGIFTLTAAQQLFLIGGIAIAVGVFTYSRRVMETVGGGIFELTPVAALIVVVSHSLVLFIFASQTLERFLIAHGLPSIPLVPVSSSQAIVGAILGIGLLKGGKGVRWRLLGGIASGWAITPVVAAFISFISLFFLQNVFQQEVYRKADFRFSAPAVERIEQAGIDIEKLQPVMAKTFYNAADLIDALDKISDLSQQQRDAILLYTQITPLAVTHEGVLKAAASGRIGLKQIDDITRIEGRRYLHCWQLDEDLAGISSQWRQKPGDPLHNRILSSQLEYLHRIFRVLK